MKSFYKRFLAYFIDMIIISLITMSITYIPVFKNDLANYRKLYREYNEKYNTYLSFNSDFNKYYKDDKLSVDEYNKLSDKYNIYSDIFNKYYLDNKLTKKNYKKIINEVNNRWSKEYKVYNYKLNKYSIINNISSFIVILIYFLGCNIVMNGMTVGKKVMKLRIVSNTDNTDVSKLQYLIRTIILYNPIYYLVIVFGLFIFNVNDYFNFSYVLSDIKNYLELIIVFMIIIRKDNRGLHELLSSTKVIMIDNKIKEENKDDVMVIKKDNNSKIKKGKKKKRIIIDEE